MPRRSGFRWWNAASIRSISLHGHRESVLAHEERGGHQRTVHLSTFQHQNGAFGDQLVDRGTEVRVGERDRPGQRSQLHWATLHGLEDNLRRRPFGQYFKRFDDIGTKASMATGMWIDDDSTADGDAGRRLTNDEAVPFGHGQRLGDTQLNPGLFTWLDPFVIEERHSRQRLG